MNNSSSKTNIFSPTAEMRLYLCTFVGINCVLSLLIIIGNSLVLVSIIVNVHLRTKCNFFLFSLAVADVLVGVVSIPFWNYHLFYWMKTDQNLVFLYTLWDVLLGIASIMSLLALSIVRCFSVVKPFLFSAQQNQCYVIAAILFPWSSGSLACVTMYYLNKLNDIHSGSYMSAFHFVPDVMILIAYFTMFKVGSKTAQKNFGSRNRIREELKAAKTAGIIIACLNVSWLPFFFFQIYLATEVSKEDISNDIFIHITWWMPVVKTLQYSHSAVNPFIYGVRNKEFRNTFRKIINKCIRKCKLENRNTPAVSESHVVEVKNVSRERSISIQTGLADFKNIICRKTDQTREITNAEAYV